MVYYSTWGVNTINPFLTNIPQVYQNFNQFIDGVLAFALFFSIAHWVFSKKYPGKEGKMVSVAIGAILTFSFVLLEQRTGFRFGGPEMASFGWIIFLIVLAILLYELLVGALGEEKKGCAMAFTFIVIHSIFLGIYTPQYQDLLMQAPLINFILAILLIASLVKIIICIVGAFKNGGPGDDHGGDHGGGDDGHGGGNGGHGGGNGGGHGGGHGGGNGGGHGGGHGGGNNSHIQIDLRVPTHVNVGAPVRVVAHITGGQGSYTTTLLVDGHPVAQVQGDTIDQTFQLPPGRHTITVHATDGHENQHKDSTIVVDTPDFRALINNLRNAINRHHNIRDQVVQMGNAMLDLNAIIQGVSPLPHGVTLPQAQQQFQALIVRFTQMNAALASAQQEVQQAQDALTHHPLLSFIPAQLAQAHGALNALYVTNVRNFARYWLEYQQRLQNGQTHNGIYIPRP